ncbi:MAG: cob(I)yrinic acid a,c-diamide adenosyltransferase [Bacteroidales bacterium]
MKIYTKTGDAGTTSLLGGSRVSKYHIRLEAYGTVDELNAHVGMLHDMIDDAADKTFIADIQQRLFTICSHLANEDSETNQVPDFSEDDVQVLENKIDEYVSQLPELKNFILPGGHVASSQAHIARTVCRRAERRVIQLSTEIQVNDLVIKYLNRLSDFLFILARKVLKDFNKSEITWNPIL